MPSKTALGHEGLVDRSHTSRTVTRVDGRAHSDVVILIVIGLGHCSQEDLMEEHIGKRRIRSETSQPTWVRRAVSPEASNNLKESKGA